jgi:hypothetical protein
VPNVIKIDTKQHEFPIDDEASLFYVIPSGKALSLLFARFSVDGKVDPGIESGRDSEKIMSFLGEALEMFITGWKGFVDSEGGEIPFSEEMLEYIPSNVGIRFLGEIVTESFKTAFADVGGLEGNSGVT